VLGCDRRLFRILFAATAAALSATSFAARADTAPPAVVIVDGSGSMWGKMDGNEAAKFYATRDALRELLEKTPSQSRIGLASFGHRRKGDCGDVEILAPVEAGGAGGAIAALEQLSPKGKGPVASALREAAKATGTRSAGHIVLVHDNLDNCGQDICAAAAEIGKTSPALKVHVVSLGLSKSERERMRCVAKATGGTQFDAGNEAEIATALEQAFRLAGLDAATAPVAAATPAAAPLPQPTGPPGLRLTAAMAEGAAMIDSPIAWRIARADAPADEAPLVERSSREINETLTPGRYTVAAALGLVTRSFDIDVAAEGPTVKRLSLDAGALKVAASASRQGDKLAAPVMTVAAVRDGETQAAAPLWIGREATADLIVPAASYAVDVTDGLARSRATVAIAPGATIASELVLETGQLELTATGVAGGPPLDRVLYLIEVDDPAAPQGRREIARSTAPVATFTVQAGTYYVTARHGTSEVRERVAVSSGDIVKRTVVLDVARLTVKATLVGAVLPPALAIVTRVYEADGQKRLVGQSTEAGPTFVLGAGRYRVDAQVGTLNIRTSQTIALTAGKDAAIELKLAAGEIAVAGLGAGEGGSASVQAAIRDAAGRVVWRSRAGGELKAVVAPGTYVLEIDTADTRIQRSVSLAPGEARVVDVASP